MNTLEINLIINKDPVLSKIYLGTFACDQLPESVYNYPCSMIVNTDPSFKSGEHWVAIYFDQEHCCEYFDSFGLLPYIPSIVNFIKNNSTSLSSYNYFHLQSVYSSVCGLYCIYFLYQRCRKISFNEVLKLFSFRDHKLNDAIICNFIYKSFTVCHKVCRKSQNCKSFINQRSYKGLN